MELRFSFVIPVYNRPGELNELLGSLERQRFGNPFEVVIVEDGSELDAREVVSRYEGTLDIKYLRKDNTGPGDSRNFGMQHAGGNYFILVDSDCILPEGYLKTVSGALAETGADCFGGRDAADPSFSPLQQAISFSMTSPLTTGGLRGAKKRNDKFQPRSFNMGLSREAFIASGGFGDIHPGEDPDLSLRLRKLGFRLAYFPQVVVYHKRRIDLKSFFRQVYKFGLARPILNRWHPGTARPAYWFPTIFCAGLIFSIVLPFFLDPPPGLVPAGCFLAYLLVSWSTAWFTTKSFRVALLVVPALLVQFSGYGWGFFKSTILLTFSRKNPKTLFPGLFFNS